MKREKSKQLISEYKKFIFTGVDLLPNIIKSGKGSYVLDIDNNKILDLNAGQFCSIFGHGWPKLNRIIQNQLKKICHTGTNTISEEVLDAAKNVSIICKEMNGKVIFLSTGSEAIECAMRFAKSIKKKDGFVCFDNGYHGLTLGSQSVTFGGKWSLPKINLVYSLQVPNFHEIDKKNIKKSVLLSLKELEKIFKSHNKEIAGFIMEPIISVGGMIFLPKEYCDGIYNLCKKYDIFLIYDECQTGIGRTGKWFCYQNTNVIPDILISAKGIGAGFPISMVIFNGLSVNLDEVKINHFSSHQNDPISAAIASAVIKEINEKNILNKVIEKGDYFIKKMTSLSEKYKLIKNPRGKGLMIGFDIYKKDLNSYIDFGKKFSNDLLDEGIMLQSTSHGKTYRLLPNYLVSKKEIDFFIKKLEIVIKKNSPDA